MPRARKPESERRRGTYLRMERGIHAWIDAYARSHGRTFSAQLHRMLESARRRLERGEPEEPRPGET